MQSLANILINVMKVFFHEEQLNLGIYKKCARGESWIFAHAELGIVICFESPTNCPDPTVSIKWLLPNFPNNSV